MPVTPFHFGPGLIAKGVAPRRFSWLTFAVAQVVIDCETLYHIVRREYPLHRQLHTLVGATLAGLATAGTALALRRVFPGAVRRLEHRFPSLRTDAPETAILLGGLIGGFSHPLLDGLMHADVRPFGPWSDANPLLGLVGLGTLHWGCVVAAVLGAILVSRSALPERR